MLVQNRPGVLARVAGLFARRGYNIFSLAVAPTEDDAFSRITIVVDVESTPLEQVVKQLFKLIEVVKISELDPRRSVERELLLATVRVTSENRGQVVELTNIFEGKILAVGVEAITVSLDGHPDKLDDFEELLRGYGIVELQRTGRSRAAQVGSRSTASRGERESSLMAAKVYYEADADSSIIRGRKVAIIGYGSQGHAHALNLKESGVPVVVGLREGSEVGGQGRGRRAHREEHQRRGQVGRRHHADDARHRAEGHVRGDIKPHLKKGKALAFAHGFNIRFKRIRPPKTVDVIMIAPKGPGHLVRRTYTEGGGVPALIAVHQDATGQAHDRRTVVRRRDRRALVPVSSRPPSPRRPRPTCSASRPCCAVA